MKKTIPAIILILSMMLFLPLAANADILDDIDPDIRQRRDMEINDTDVPTRTSFNKVMTIFPAYFNIDSSGKLYYTVKVSQKNSGTLQAELSVNDPFFGGLYEESLGVPPDTDSYYNIPLSPDYLTGEHEDGPHEVRFWIKALDLAADEGWSTSSSVSTFLGIRYESDKNMSVGETIDYSCKDYYYTGEKVICQTSDPSVVSVDNETFTMTAEGTGTALIAKTTENNELSLYRVTVSQPANTAAAADGNDTNGTSPEDSSSPYTYSVKTKNGHVFKIDIKGLIGIFVALSVVSMIVRRGFSSLIDGSKNEHYGPASTNSFSKGRPTDPDSGSTYHAGSGKKPPWEL